MFYCCALNILGVREGMCEVDRAAVQWMHGVTVAVVANNYDSRNNYS